MGVVARPAAQVNSPLGSYWRGRWSNNVMSFLDRFRRRSTPTTGDESVEPAAQSSVADDDVRMLAMQAVLPGFRVQDDAVEFVRETLELDDTDNRPATVVGEVWSQRLAEERSWEGASDYHRLEAAFADLNNRGVAARMNFTCCNTCGTDEIDNERTPIEVAEGYPFQESAYTFFHQQDAERLGQDPSVLYLTYSSWLPAEDLDPALVEAARSGDIDARNTVVSRTDALIGAQVTEVLSTHGLLVRWDGDPTERIEVQIANWRKPLPR
jgi:hypothetical protein